MSRHDKTRRVSQIMEVKDIENLAITSKRRKSIVLLTEKQLSDITLQSGVMLNHCILYREVNFETPSMKIFQYNPQKEQLNAFALHKITSDSMNGNMILYKDASSVLESCCNSLMDDVLWFHITDRDILPLVFSHFRVHPVARNAFYDNLPRTTFNFFDKHTMLCTMTTFCLQDDGIICTIKVFIYICNNIVITQERRSHAVLKEANQPILANKSSNSLTTNKVAATPTSAQKPSGSTVRASNVHEREILGTGPNPECNVYTGRVYGSLYTQLQDKYALNQVSEVGSSFLLYITFRTMIDMTTPVINFYSNQQLMLHDTIHVRESQPTHSEGNDILDRIDFIKSGIQIMENLVDRATKGLISAEGKMESYIPSEWTTDIISEYEYTYDCIGDMEKELASLTDNVNGIISRRNEQISIVLSLVSTVFLPLTFIAGVFGMNFSNGGILVYILNMRNGTNVFWIGCASCVLYCLYVFVAKGWMDMLGKVRRGGLFAASAQQQHDTSLLEFFKIN